jgi:hypothetical protein
VDAFVVYTRELVKFSTRTQEFDEALWKAERTTDSVKKVVDTVSENPLNYVLCA